MRVPEDNRCDAGTLRIEIKPLHVVEHVDAAAVELDQLSGWQMIAGAALIDIAPNGGNRRYRAKSIEDGRIADIAGMENMLRTLQCL
jgi:hypothetical protein